MGFAHPVHRRGNLIDMRNNRPKEASGKAIPFTHALKGKDAQHRLA